jgi:hypothetical protein
MNFWGTCLLLCASTAYSEAFAERAADSLLILETFGTTECNASAFTPDVGDTLISDFEVHDPEVDCAGVGVVLSNAVEHAAEIEETTAREGDVETTDFDLTSTAWATALPRVTTTGGEMIEGFTVELWVRANHLDNEGGHTAVAFKKETIMTIGDHGYEGGAAAADNEVCATFKDCIMLQISQGTGAGIDGGDRKALRIDLPSTVVTATDGNAFYIYQNVFNSTSDIYHITLTVDRTTVKVYVGALSADGSVVQSPRELTRYIPSDSRAGENFIGFLTADLLTSARIMLGTFTWFKYASGFGVAACPRTTGTCRPAGSHSYRGQLYLMAVHGATLPIASVTQNFEAGASPAAATTAPTAVPTAAPTDTPTDAPTAAPTAAPTDPPTDVPTAAPTDAPTDALDSCGDDQWSDFNYGCASRLDMCVYDGSTGTRDIPGGHCQRRNCTTSTAVLSGIPPWSEGFSTEDLRCAYDMNGVYTKRSGTNRGERWTRTVTSSVDGCDGTQTFTLTGELGASTIAHSYWWVYGNGGLWILRSNERAAGPADLTWRTHTNGKDGFTSDDMSTVSASCVVTAVPPTCTGGKVFQDCGSGCDKTCIEPNPVCTTACIAKCQCPSTQPYWDESTSECTTQSTCSASSTFDPTSTFVAYTDRGSCGPRGNDAKATASCAGGGVLKVIPEYTVSMDRYRVKASVAGCNYFGWTTYECAPNNDIAPTPAPTTWCGCTIFEATDVWKRAVSADSSWTFKDDECSFAMDKWCNVNCPKGFCPESHCKERSGEGCANGGGACDSATGRCWYPIMDVVLVKSSLSFEGVNTSFFGTEEGRAPVRKALAQELDVKESQVEIIGVTSTTTRRRLGAQTVVEYQIVVDLEDYAQLDATTAKIESGLAPSTFNMASDQLADAVVSPSRSDSIETAAGVPSLTFAALQSDSEDIRESAALSSPQAYEGPQLTIDSELTASASTTVEGEGGLSGGVIAGVTIGIVVVVALVATTYRYSKRQTKTILSTQTVNNPSMDVSRKSALEDDHAATAAVI